MRTISLTNSKMRIVLDEGMPVSEARLVFPDGRAIRLLNIGKEDRRMDQDGRTPPSGGSGVTQDQVRAAADRMLAYNSASHERKECDYSGFHIITEYLYKGSRSEGWWAQWIPSMELKMTLQGLGFSSADWHMHVPLSTFEYALSAAKEAIDRLLGQMNEAQAVKEIPVSDALIKETDARSLIAMIAKKFSLQDGDLLLLQFPAGGGWSAPIRMHEYQEALDDLRKNSGKRVGGFLINGLEMEHIRIVPGSLLFFYPDHQISEEDLIRIRQEVGAEEERIAAHVGHHDFAFIVMSAPYDTRHREPTHTHLTAQESRIQHLERQIAAMREMHAKIVEEHPVGLGGEGELRDRIAHSIRNYTFPTEGVTVQSKSVEIGFSIEAGEITRVEVGEIQPLYGGPCGEGFVPETGDE